VHFDVAYGGAFYAFVTAEAVGLTLEPEHFNRIIDYGRQIKHAVMAQFSITHPFEPDLSFLYGTIFTGPPRDPAHHSRNVCIFADGELDRSATGSGVSARAALHFAKGELRLNERISNREYSWQYDVGESRGYVTKFGPHDAVIPEVSGTASIIGRNEFYFDPEDPFSRGIYI
jgi:proline racemase